MVFMILTEMRSVRVAIIAPAPIILFRKIITAMGLAMSAVATARWVIYGRNIIWVRPVFPLNLLLMAAIW
jgi:hypothetical protein